MLLPFRGHHGRNQYEQEQDRSKHGLMLSQIAGLAKYVIALLRAAFRQDRLVS